MYRVLHALVHWVIKLFASLSTRSRLHVGVHRALWYSVESFGFLAFTNTTETRTAESPAGRYGGKPRTHVRKHSHIPTKYQ